MLLCNSIRFLPQLVKMHRKHRKKRMKLGAFALLYPRR